MSNNKISLIAVSAFMVANVASAGTYTVFLHGRSETSWSGARPMVAGTSQLNIDVGNGTGIGYWDGTSHVGNGQSGNTINYGALASKCATGTCYFQVYSTGGLIEQQTEKFIASGAYGSSRSGNVRSYESAEHGSGLANLCSWFTQWFCSYGGVDENLALSSARNWSNQGTGVYSNGMIEGNGCLAACATAPFIDGDDDGAVGPESIHGCLGNDSYAEASCTVRTSLLGCGSWGFSSCYRTDAQKGNRFDVAVGGWSHTAVSLGGWGN